MKVVEVEARSAVVPFDRPLRIARRLLDTRHHTPATLLQGRRGAAVRALAAVVDGCVSVPREPGLGIERSRPSSAS